MNWLQRYRVRHYLRNSLWVWPVVALGAALVAVRLLHAFETSLNLEAKINPDTARAVLGSLAGAMFTFIVFVCSSLLLVVQLASAQLTLRVIATMFRDRVTKFTMSLFVFNFTFTLASLLRINDSVPLLITEVSGYGCAASIGVFLYLIDHVGKMLRPSGVFKIVATEAHRVIEHVYPRRLSDASDSTVNADIGAPLPLVATVRSAASGVVLAFDQKGLVGLATRHDCLIEMAPQVGDFVAPGDALFRVYGKSADLSSALVHSIAFGAERTVEQDPAFAFRVIVDIAAKGLSPAINDPTTAVLAVDQLYHLLRHVGSRRLDNERIRDAAGRVCLIVRTPDWEDFVKLAITEIRQFGGASIQIARRLRAMLEDLIETLREVRAAPLRAELALLTKSAERFFQEPEDRTLAEKSDSQGVGGIRIVGRPRSESVSSDTNP